MRTAGIICEYNPFHMGHKHQIDTLHTMGYDCVVCVMSGNFTQRGDLAMFDKYTRAKSAVLGGADLVLELPFPYSSMSAEGFANAGIHILASIGVDAICFGSECNDKSLLVNAANAITSPEFPQIYSELIKSGLGSTSAYLEAVKHISGTNARLLSNDILGISYIAAIKKGGYHIDILPIKREGAAYNDKNLKAGEPPSASAIREAVKKSELGMSELLCGHVPDLVLECLTNAKNEGLAPVFADNIASEILSFFKLMSPDEIAARAISRSNGGDHIAEDGCGICDRLCSIARKCKSFDEFQNRSYTSKYPNSRLNRVMLFSLLGVSDKIFRTKPEYTTLLAVNSIGRNFLARTRKTCELPIITKPADAPGEGIQKLLSESADSFYTEAIPSPTHADYFIKSHPCII